MIRLLSTSALMAAALVFTPVLPAFGHGSVDRTSDGRLENLVGHANLVFLGQVTDVRYSMEKTDVDGKSERQQTEEMPVTYVTYQIEKVIRGEPQDEKLTLRFLGGPDGKGRFLSVSGYPKMQLKERDILFVRGNGEKGCPLVGCQLGRFRVLEGGLYNPYGVAVQAIVDEGVIARGQIPKQFLTFSYPAPQFDDLIRNPQIREMLKKKGLSVDEARERFLKEAPRNVVVTTTIHRAREQMQKEQEADRAASGNAIPETDEPLQEAPIAIEEFIDHVTKLSDKLGGDFQPIESIEPGAFPVMSLQVTAPSPDIVRIDRKDEKGSLIENNNNPVLK